MRCYRKGGQREFKAHHITKSEVATKVAMEIKFFDILGKQ
jgi:hypothetical protein